MVLSGSTYAVFVTIIGRLGAKAVMTIVRVAGAPGSVVTVPLSVAPEQVMTWPLTEQVNWVAPGVWSSAEMKLVPAGRVSRTVTPNAGSVPSLVTVRT